MLLITGVDPALVEQVCHGLSREGIASSRVDATYATAERGNLFQAALDVRAQGLILIESLSWRSASPAAGETPPSQVPPAPSDDDLFSAALSATHAPGVTSLLLVTSRADDDDGLRRLRREGVPYVVLRPAPLFEIRPRGALRALRDRRVLVPSEAAAAVKDAIPVDVLVEAVIAAERGETPQGKLIDVAATPERSFVEVLARAGAKPRVVGGFRSRVGRWFGQAVVRVEGAGVVVEGAPAPVATPVAASAHRSPNDHVVPEIRQYPIFPAPRRSGPTGPLPQK